MFSTNHTIPIEELALRHSKCRALLARLCPQAGGIMVFNRLSIYYLSGTFGKDMLWLPREGEPMLFARKGFERAQLESPLKNIFSFRSYRDITTLINDHGTGLPPVVAVEKNALTWGLAETFTKAFPGTEFIAGDAVLPQTRSRKTPWELNIIREATRRHNLAVRVDFPANIHVGMSEKTLSRVLLNLCFDRGHSGHIRMAAHNEENYFGHVSVGTSGNYPTYFNGALGVQGQSPSAPFMGSDDILWEKNTLLAVDPGFVLNGYNSDITQTFFSGAAADIPDTVKKAHQVCMDIESAVAAMLRPGAIPSALYNHALRMADEAGFAKEFMGAGTNQVPFLGHGLGLALDEWPVLANRFDEPLEASMTIAIEPKIGIPGYGMVGTENTYEVTEGAAVALTSGAKDIICVE